MSDAHVVSGFVDGYLRKFRLHSVVDADTVQRLMRLTAVPLGGTYVIHHPPCNAEGRDFFSEFRARNPAMRTFVGYTAFETDCIPEEWVKSCNQMDEIWVPSFFNVQTFSRSGVQREKLHVIPHCFDARRYEPAETTPLEVGVKKGFTFLSVFEWTYRKGWDVLIRAFLEEFMPREDVRLILRSYQGGGVTGDVPPVIEQLRSYITGLGYDPENIPHIEFIDQMVPAEMMPALYRSADVFVMPTRGEGWGIPFTESMLMEVPVIATNWSGHLQFMNSHNSYLIDVEKLVPVGDDQIRDNPLYGGQKWAEPSVTHTRQLMREVFESREELREKGRIAREHIMTNFSAKNIAPLIAHRVSMLSRKGAGIRKPAGREESSRKGGKTRGKIRRVLFQARGNVFTLPGGDTQVMTRLKSALEEKGITVDISSNMQEELKAYDLVHIFNFDSGFGVNAGLQEKSFIVTPMYEDLGRYTLPALETFGIFKNALSSGAMKDIDAGLENMTETFREQKRGAPSDYQFIARRASAIFVSGNSEGLRIKRDYSGTSLVETVRLGFDRVADGGNGDPAAFHSAYGVADYILCVGRLETRKNQLMLLHALRDEELPLVFVNSHTIQPDYEDLCRNYPRRGKTIFTGRISQKLLHSAYSGAIVHALPSWYELPGLVSLEAAWRGCNVVAPDWGTVRDYLGDHVFYCEPHNPDSVKKALLRAMNDPYREDVRQDLAGLTWSSTAEQVLDIYERVLSMRRTARGIRSARETAEEAQREHYYHHMRGRAYALSQVQPEKAIGMVEQLLKFRQQDPTSYLVMGVAYLFLMKYGKSEENLKLALDLQPHLEVRVYLYLALALFQQHKYEEAMATLQKALLLHPFCTDETKALIHEYLTRAYQAVDENRGEGRVKDLMERISMRETVSGRSDRYCHNLNASQ